MESKTLTGETVQHPHGHVKIGEFGVFGEHGTDLLPHTTYAIPAEVSATFAAYLVGGERARYADAPVEGEADGVAPARGRRATRAG